jgi:hypothetical protein
LIQYIITIYRTNVWNYYKCAIQTLIQYIITIYRTNVWNYYK